MSIRLRLTLIYTAILSLTLIIFSVLIYVGQSQAMLGFFQVRLIDKAQIVFKAMQTQPDIDTKTLASPPVTNLTGQDINRFGAYYIQVRALDGAIIEPPANLADITLPLSAAGRQAVQNGEDWLETISIDGERLLIYSRRVERADKGPVIVQIGSPLTFLDQGQKIMKGVTATINAILTLAAFGMGWVLAGLTLRPIHRITQIAQAIGREHDFTRRVDHSGPDDEIGQLATTFNKMLTELQAAYMQVDQSLQAQRQFVADASHELRTPLTTLRGNIGLLRLRPPISAEDQADVLQDMVDETERLMRLVNNLLVLARADAKRPFRSEPVAVQPLLEDVCRQTQLLNSQRTIVCQSNTATAIKGDADALKQVLLALLDNALKHTPVNTTVTITTTDTAEHVVIRIADNGPGIEPALLPHIFDRFYRGNVARTGDGIGLGLAIAKELTEAQHGTINVESQVGQGSMFTLAFPRCHVAHVK